MISNLKVPHSNPMIQCNLQPKYLFFFSFNISPSLSFDSLILLTFYSPPSSFPLTLFTFHIDGWDNLCTYADTMSFISGKIDGVHCSVNDRDSYLQGCTTGFYQPMLDITQSPKACPDGFFCPENYACTL